MSEKLSKRQLIERLWISIAQRLPPDSDTYETQVVTYNAKTGYIAVLPTKMAREYATEAVNILIEPDKWSWDREFTHWMTLYPPAGKPTYEEHLAQTESAKKSVFRKKQTPRPSDELDSSFRYGL